MVFLWEDVHFENLVLHIRRSVVAMVEGAPKTEASLKDVPLDAQTAESLALERDKTIRIIDKGTYTALVKRYGRT